MTQYLLGHKYIVFLSLFSVKKFLMSVSNHTMETEKKSSKNIQTHLFHQQTFIFNISHFFNQFLPCKANRKKIDCSKLICVGLNIKFSSYLGRYRMWANDHRYNNIAKRSKPNILLLPNIDNKSTDTYTSDMHILLIRYGHDIGTYNRISMAFNVFY